MKVGDLLSSCVSFLSIYIAVVLGLCYYGPELSSDRLFDGKILLINDVKEDFELAKRRMSTGLGKKFFIQGPSVGEIDGSIYLDFITGDWVTADRIHHKVYDFECEEEDPNSSLLSTGSIRQNTELDTSDDGYQTWRLPLSIGNTNRSVIRACVTWSLWNLPQSNEHAFEVNFVETQATIYLHQGNISKVRVALKEREGIQVNIMGGAKKKKNEEASKEL